MTPSSAPPSSSNAGCDAPDYPFLIELFTPPPTATKALLTSCLTPTTPLALRVQDNNTPAITLYKRLGFTASRTADRHGTAAPELTDPDQPSCPGAERPS